MKKMLSNSKFAGLALGLIALLAITTAAGVNGKFNSVTSALGYQVAGAAGTSGQALCSDGTRYDTACTIPPAPVTPSQKNCLVSSCVGGSTYAASTTYTNSGAVSVLEEVTMQAGSGAVTGCDYQLTPTIAGATGPVSGIYNDANSRMTASTFKVIPGANFSVTIALVGGGGGCGAPTILSWLEVIG